VKAIEVVKPEKMIRLAAMECGASCLMTALRMLGKNPNHFLLDYWNITYESESQLLMGNRDLSSEYFEWVFGLRLELKQSDLPSIGRFVKNGGFALLLCNPANLAYFPKKFITDELGGDHHYVLVYGYDPDNRIYQLVDPIAHYIGELTDPEMSHGVETVDFIEHYALTEPRMELPPPEHQELFAFAAKRNYENARLEDTMLACDKFSEDITQIVHWEEDERDHWIYQNNVTISTIVKLRALVWNSFVELGVLKPEQIETGQRSVQSIVKQWTAFNFQLTKFKRHLEENHVSFILKQFAAIQEVEQDFLAWMYHIACKGEA
jgi:hypothetical protein